MKSYHRVYAVIHLDAAVKNMQQMQANISDNTAVMGVVKADGYGHGSVPIAKAINPYVEAFATATIEEAVILRKHSIHKPILVLGTVPYEQYEDLLCYDICPTIYTLQQAKQLSELSIRQGKRASVHIAVDTGMSRIGFPPTEESAETIAQISRMPGILLEGMFTHFARADETDKAFTDKQLSLYDFMVHQLKLRQVEIPVKHCSNSAGIVDFKKANLDMVRAGISIYGMYPSEQVDQRAVELTPVLELKSVVAFVKEIEADTPVSYGGTFVSDKPMTIATIPVGYGDGYPRSLSNKGFVLIHGRKARILGRVCMDQMMVDVTNIPEVQEGDTVTLIGTDGKEEITAMELSRLSQGFHYELVCDIGKRVPRIYIQNGRMIGAKDYFNDVFEDFIDAEKK